MAKKFTVDINSDDEADETGDGETESATVQCVTCGIGVTRKWIIVHCHRPVVIFPLKYIYTETNAIRHMERCFNKYESQTSFGSIFQTKIEGNNMFCDFYNPANQTYCKRLRVLCPEHSIDPKVIFQKWNVSSYFWIWRWAIYRRVLCCRSMTRMYAGILWYGTSLKKLANSVWFRRKNASNTTIGKN
jgi:hypothetical protein